jgi:hypothetical protein
LTGGQPPDASSIEPLWPAGPNMSGLDEARPFGRKTSAYPMKNEPPEQLDGAKVLWWAWSGNAPFFVMPYSDGSGGIQIHGLAICQYESGSIYHFSCNREWEVENDSNWSTIEGAMTGRSGQYDVAAVKWQKR